MSAPRGCHFGTEMGTHPTACRLQCWGASGQTTNRVGTQTHPSADRLPEVVLSQQLPINTPLDTTLCTQGTRPGSTHQWEGASQSLPPGSLHKLLEQPHPPGGRQQNQEELQSCSLRNRDHKQRKLDKMRWQRNMLQKKEQDNTLEEQPRVKMIQDLGKRMESRSKKVQEMFNKEKLQRPSKTNQKQLTKCTMNIHTNNYLNHKRIKCSNQKTETG